jgi:hypothetical protein
MREIFPGVQHWTAFHPAIQARVSSYYVESSGVLIDPMVPEEGLEAVVGDGPLPQQVVLTSGNHARDADRFADAFGIPIRASVEGKERLGDALEVEIYDSHEEVAPGVQAIHVGILSPDEYALHLTATEGAIALADGANHYAPTLAFFPDELLGDDPEEIKEGLKRRMLTLLERDFDHLLFAHGDPIIGRGKKALRDFATSPAGYAEWGQAG